MDVPRLHLEFLVRYVQTADYFLSWPIPPLEEENDDIFVITWPLDGLYSTLLSFEKLRKSLNRNATSTSETKIGKAVNGRHTIEKPEIMKCLIVPRDTYVHQSHTSPALKSRDLYCEIQSCLPGYTKLCPVTNCWLNKVCDDHDKSYLKQLEYKMKTETIQTIIGFRCEIPDGALEWFDRNRKHHWPPLSFIEHMISSCTCLVTTKAHPHSQNPSTEWKFCFDLMELQLVKHAVTGLQKKAFDIFQSIIRHTFISGPVTYNHAKQVFFYTCENCNPTDWETQPADCIRAMIERLLNNFKQCFLPEYFFAEVNMIDHLSREEVSECIKKLEVLVAFPFTMLFFTFDALNSTKLYSQISVFDNVIEDVQKYVLDRDCIKSLYLCFIPCSVRELSFLASPEYYTKILNQASTAVNHLNHVCKPTSPLTLGRFLLLVATSITSDLDRWLFSFFLDQKLESYEVKSVIGEEQRTVSLFKYTGPQLKDHLKCDGNGDIRIPESLTDTAELLTLMTDLEKVFDKSLGLEPDVIAECLRYFHEHFSRVIGNYMLSCTPEQSQSLSYRLQILYYKTKIHESFKTRENLKQQMNAMMAELNSYSTKH